MTTHEILKTVKQKFKEKLTPGMEIECILVDKILPENSGKYRVVMSNVTKSASYY